MLFLWCVFFAQEPRELVKQLSELMTNSSKGLSQDGSYIDTVTRLSDEKDGWRLVVEEQLYDSPDGNKGLFERHILRVADIDSVRLHMGTKLAEKDGRNTYLILVYRQSKLGIYSFKDGEDRKFGPLLAFRVGVYQRERAERIKRYLDHLRVAP